MDADEPPRSMPVELPDLHDAILRTVDIDWESGCAHCRFDLWSGRPTADPAAEMRAVTIKLIGLKEATVHRAQPWGPSIYVNAGRLASGSGVAELVLEMQSGDEIVLRATTAEVTIQHQRNHL